MGHGEEVLEMWEVEGGRGMEKVVQETREDCWTNEKTEYFSVN